MVPYTHAQILPSPVSMPSLFAPIALGFLASPVGSWKPLRTARSSKYARSGSGGSGKCSRKAPSRTTML
eukprot:15302021-Alexandrium_andersonii.AAC.1